MKEVQKMNPDMPAQSGPAGAMFEKLAAGITGVVVSEKKELLLAAGHILQRARGGRFLETMMHEIDELVEKGAVKPDYLETAQNLDCMGEMLDFLDKDSPDNTRMLVMKKLYIGIASEKHYDRGNVLPQQLMALCRSLTSGEALVLGTTFLVSKAQDPAEGTGTGAALWLQEIAKASGLAFPELVENHERGLVAKNLLTPRHHADASGVRLGKHYRLTGLGVALCECIEIYDQLFPKST